MSCEPKFPRVPYAIRGLNHKKVQEAAEAAVKWKNEREKRCLIFKRCPMIFATTTILNLCSCDRSYK